MFLISGGQHHTLILTAEGKCLVIGNRDYGRLGLGKDNAEHLNALKEVSALSALNVVQVECGEVCSFARTSDGRVYVWGLGENFQLGLGGDEDVYEPALLASKQVKDKEVLNVNSGGQHTLLLVADKLTNGEKPAAVAVAAAVPAAAAVAVNGSTTAADSTSVPTTTAKPAAKATTAAAKKRAAQATPVTSEADAASTADSAAESSQAESVAEPAKTTAAVPVAKKRAHAPSTTSDAAFTADSAAETAESGAEQPAAASVAEKKKPGKAPAKKRK